MGIRREPVNAELMQGRPPLGNDENGRLAGLDQEVCQPQGEVPVHDEEPVPIGTMGQEANGPGDLRQSRLEDQGQFPSELEEDEHIMLMAWGTEISPWRRPRVGRDRWLKHGGEDPWHRRRHREWKKEHWRGSSQWSLRRTRR